MQDYQPAARCRIDVSAVSRVAANPRRGSAQPRDPVPAAKPFAALEIRSGLGRITARLSPRRRMAATAPLLVALVSWFVVPSAAADFQLDTSGDRYGTISHGIGGRNNYPIHIRGYGNENAGTLLMHQVGGGDVEAYCIDLRGVRNPAAVFSSGERRIDQIAYILNHNFPVARDGGALADIDQEAAAVQLAVWTFSDGVNLDGVSAPTVANFAVVINRARQIVNAAAANWGPWASQQSAQPAVALRMGPPAAAPGQTPLTATVSGGPSGGVPDGTPMTFTVTTPVGTVDGRRSTTRSITGGTTTVQVGSDSPGMVSVRAQVTVNGLAYLQLNPSIRPNQTLILASQLPVSGEGGQNAAFTGTPHLTITKAVADAGLAGTTVEAKPGDPIKYTISYANTGTAPATATSIRDDFSQGELKRLAAPGIALAGGRERAMDREARVATWTLGDVPPGGAGSVDAEARVPESLADGGQGIGLCNTATISSVETPPTASNSACAHVTTTPHLVTVKVVDAGTAAPGQTLRYTIDVRNDGSRDLTAVTVTDPMKGGSLELLTDVKPSTGGTFDEATRTLTWTVATLAAGAAASMGFTAAVPAAGLPKGQTCFVNVATAGAGNGVGTFPSGPVTSCAHVPAPTPAPSASPTPAASVPAPAATPSPPVFRPGLPVAGSGPLELTDKGSPSPPAVRTIAGARATPLDRHAVRISVVGACLLLSALILVTGLRPRGRVRSGI